jgi:hypothetical protein
MHNFSHLYEKNIPLIKLNHCNRKSQPRSKWITSSLLKSINYKNKLYRKFLRSPSEANRLIFTKYKNSLTTILRSAKQAYFSNQFEKEKNNTRNTWKVINSVLKNNTSIRISSINVNDQSINNPLLIAEHYNDFFVNIGPTLADKIPNCNSTFHDFFDNPNPHSVFFNPITENELLSIVLTLPNKKSSGHDSINCPLIKEVIQVISKPLVYIMNLSLSSGIVPDSMKIARVTPIHKNGDRHMVNNYRPISILTSFSKILERTVYIRTSLFLQKHNILSNSQFGFREKHSTTHAILKLIDRIRADRDQSLHTMGIFLDLSKAFDTIDHSILLSKLSFYGIRGIALEWFRNYLSNRKQFVCIDGKESSLKSLICGIPQGSLLAPLLFSLYINDFPKSSDKFSFILFADDSNLFCSHRSLDTLFDIVNRELVHISNWIKANKLSINIKKTNFMLFGPFVNNLPCDIFFDNVPILRTNCIKFLGLYIDDKLSWNFHINYICKLISRNIGMISKLSYFFPSEILYNIYSALILPYISYGVLAWGKSSAYLLNRITILQNRALRIINRVGFRAHSNPLFLKHRTLKVSDIYLHQLGIFMHQFISNNLPNSLQNMFVFNSQIHSYQTRHSHDFHIPFCSSSRSMNCVSFQGPKYWNSLDDSLKRCKGTYMFKRKLKCVLLDNYHD